MRETLLIMEGDPAIRHVIGLVLKEEGYEVAFATSGRDGLTKLAMCAPAAIVLDSALPDMSGREFLSLLGRRPPVLMLTLDYRNREEVGRLAQSYAVESCLPMPFLLQDVVREVERLTHGAGRALGRAPEGSAPARDQT